MTQVDPMLTSSAPPHPRGSGWAVAFSTYEVSPILALLTTLIAMAFTAVAAICGVLILRVRLIGLVCSGSVGFAPARLGLFWFGLVQPGSVLFDLALPSSARFALVEVRLVWICRVNLSLFLIMDKCMQAPFSVCESANGGGGFP